MATHQISLFNHLILPQGTDGDVFMAPFSNYATTPIYDPNVLVFAAATGRKMEVAGGFIVPQNYVGTATFRCLWTVDATSNDWEFDIEYRAIAVGEASNPGTDQETLNVADTAPGTAFFLQEAVLTPTASNFATGDLVLFHASRDDSDAGDTLSAPVLWFDLLFQYADA